MEEELEQNLVAPKFKFSKKSLERISECHPNLQKIAHELIKELDVTVLCGHRGERDQNHAFNTGKSKLRWPRSKHNQAPSLAIDIAPYPIDWNNIPRFEDMCDRIKRIASSLKIKIRQGREFSFSDYPHTELHDKAKK